MSILNSVSGYTYYTQHTLRIAVYKLVISIPAILSLTISWSLVVKTEAASCNAVAKWTESASLSLGCMRLSAAASSNIALLRGMYFIYNSSRKLSNWLLSVAFASLGLDIISAKTISEASFGCSDLKTAAACWPNRESALSV